MSTATPARPAQVTFAGWLTIGASVVAVVMAFAEVSRVGSLETQQAIQRFLADDPGQSLGLSVADVQELLRVASTAAAACAAITGVLGWFVLQRSRGSRLALSVVAAPLLLAGLFSGGFAAAIVAASATMLWLQPARGWFAGEAPPSRSPARRSADRVAVPAPTTARVPAVPPAASPPYAPPVGPPLATWPAPAGALRRPAALAWACLVTWLCTGTATALLLLTSVLMAAEPHLLLDEAHRQNPDLAEQGITDATIRASVYGISAVVVVWSIAAAVLAVLAWRRVRWAMVALLVSAFAAGGLCLLLSIGSLLLLAGVAACAVTVWLLLRPDVRRWYAVR